jgi:hypothetical protein
MYVLLWHGLLCRFFPSHLTPFLLYLLLIHASSSSSSSLSQKKNEPQIPYRAIQSIERQKNHNAGGSSVVVIASKTKGQVLVIEGIMDVAAFVQVVQNGVLLCRNNNNNNNNEEENV